MAFGFLLNNPQLKELAGRIEEILSFAFVNEEVEIIYNGEFLTAEDIKNHIKIEGTIEHWEGANIVCVIKSKSSKMEIIFKNNEFEKNIILK